MNKEKQGVLQTTKIIVNNRWKKVEVLLKQIFLFGLEILLGNRPFV